MPLAEQVGRQFDLWSAKVAVSANEWEHAGGNGPQTQLMAFGNRVGAGGRLRVGHSAMADILDIDALAWALRRAGLDVGPGPLSPQHRDRVVAVYAKFSLPVDGRLRGRRQIVENPEYGNQVKAALGGMFSAILQENMIWISGSATHQGPAGGWHSGGHRGCQLSLRRSGGPAALRCPRHPDVGPGHSRPVRNRGLLSRTQRSSG